MVKFGGLITLHGFSKTLKLRRSTQFSKGIQRLKIMLEIK